MGCPAGVVWQEGPGSVVSTWTCSQLNFNSVYAPNVPAAGVIGYNFTSPDSQSFSGLCVAAVNPVPPPLGTPQQVQWALDEMACFIHYNMATAAGTQVQEFFFASHPHVCMCAVAQGASPSCVTSYDYL